MADDLPQDEQLVIALARGATVAEAAAEGGVSERTVYRRLEESEFRVRVASRRDAAIGCVTGRLSEINLKAAETLEGLLDSVDEKIQLQAAKACIELGMKIRDSSEIADRLTELERRYNEQRKAEDDRE